MLFRVSVSVRGNSGFWPACLWPPKFRFPDAKAETPRDRFAFGQRRVRQSRHVGVWLPQDLISVESALRNAELKLTFHGHSARVRQ
jgi:hypothetical protein